MFLSMLQQRNPNLISALFKLHQQGAIMPDTTVLDLEAIRHNAQVIAQHAKSHHLKPFFITKQFGFNPFIAKAIINAGFEGIVCVDFREAQMCMRHQLPIAHIGHLVQMPRAFIPSVIEYGVQYCTIYSLEQAQLIHNTAQILGIKQKILIKVIADNGFIYKGQEGGFHLEQLPSLTTALKALSHLEIAGLTAFPCWLYSEPASKIIATENVYLLHAAQEILQNLGYAPLALNMPSANAHCSIADIAAAGGAHIEAGHSLTGTTPAHAYHAELAEIPAMAYLSEISHHYQSSSYFYGGGCYRRYPIARALVGHSHADAQMTSVNKFDSESIDYHFTIPQKFEIGATVIASFRTQVFVTRSEVVVLDKVQSNPEKVEICAKFSVLGDER